MGTNTTNYSFSKPTVDGDEDTWGTQLNGNWDKTDSLLSGGQDISSLSITTSVTLKGQGNLVFKDSDSSHSVSLQAPTTIASNYTLTMPTGDGSNGQVLTTDGSGGLSFTTISGFSGAFGDLTGKPTTISGYGITDAFDGAYSSLTGTPTIPTNNNQLTNGAGYITSADGGNADTLDGINSTGFVRQLGDATSPNYQTASSRRVDPNSGNPTNEHYAITTFGNGSNVTGQIAAHFQTGQLYSRGYNSSFSAWRKIWNDQNDGSGSGLDADLLDGYHASTTRNSANTIPIRNSSGYLDLGWINTTSGATGSTISRIYASQDAYIRYVTPATFRSQVISGQTINEIYNDGWYRSNGARGWYNQTYGGGIFMQDTTYVRTYGSKQFFVNNHIKTSHNVYAYYSDERLKTKTGDIDNALDKVQSLSGFTYVENELAKELGYNSDEEQVGVSAQQVQAVCPQAVHLAPVDEKVEDDGTIVSKSGEDYMTVDYPRLVPLLIEAIKELKGQVDDLQTQIKELQQ